jgi:hypothetical protein
MSEGGVVHCAAICWAVSAACCWPSSVSGMVAKSSVQRPMFAVLWPWRMKVARMVVS